MAPAAAGVEPAAGDGPPVTWQVLDGQAGQHARQASGRQRPPQRLGGEAQALRQAGEDPVLQVADEGQVPVGGGGDRDAEERGDEQQDEVALAAQQRDRVGVIVGIRPARGSSDQQVDALAAQARSRSATAIRTIIRSRCLSSHMRSRSSLAAAAAGVEDRVQLHGQEA